MEFGMGGAILLVVGAVLLCMMAFAFSETDAYKIDDMGCTWVNVGTLLEPDEVCR